jgi:hypothetical protein
VRSPLVTLCIVATVNETRLQLYLDAEAKILGGVRWPWRPFLAG